MRTPAAMSMRGRKCRITRRLSKGHHAVVVHKNQRETVAVTAEGS